jgi:glucuronate isomerase
MTPAEWQLEDESACSRELASLAGDSPAMKLGRPWWFHDSTNGMKRSFEPVIETAGLYKPVGLNDDARAFPSIPARHCLWRRAAGSWLSGLVVRRIADVDDARNVAEDAAYRLARQAYRFGG